MLVEDEERSALESKLNYGLPDNEDWGAYITISNSQSPLRRLKRKTLALKEHSIILNWEGWDITLLLGE